MEPISTGTSDLDLDTKTPVHTIGRLQRLINHKVQRGALVKYDYLDELAQTVQRILEGGVQKSSSPDAILQGGVILEHLYDHKAQGIPHALLYIQTCIQMSRLSGGVMILLNHFQKIYEGIPENLSEQYVTDLEGYYAEKKMNYDKYVHKIIESRHISYREALREFEILRRELAQFHIFLEAFYNAYIFPTVDSLTSSQELKMSRSFMDLQNILYGDFSLPLGFLDRKNDETRIDTKTQRSIFREKRIKN